MTKLRFLRQWRTYAPGDVGSVMATVAAVLIERGIAAPASLADNPPANRAVKPARVRRK